MGLNLLRVGYLAEDFTLNMSWTQPEKGILAYQRSKGLEYSSHPIFSFAR